MAAAKERVTIVGGGMSALAAALALTDPQQQGRYEVTVYQMGWRLGGQGASGRNRRCADRIEEHGLHLWFGCYDNAFAVMRQVYTELGRTDGPIRTLDDAFKGKDDCVLEESTDAGWAPWRFDFPPNPLGAGGRPTIWNYLLDILEWIGELLGKSVDLHALVGEVAQIQARRAWWQPMLDSSIALPDGVEHPLARAQALQLGDLLEQLRQFVRALDQQSAQRTAQQQEFLVWLIGVIARAAWALVGGRVQTDAGARHFWIMFYLGATAARAMLADDLVGQGFDSADQYDLRDYFVRHQSIDGSAGAEASRVAFWSPLMQALYDAAFAYQDGDPARPGMGAGTALRISMRLLMEYKGHFFYEMQAGMGDTIFAPLYQVLQRRGVVFRFFHRVTQLELDDAGVNLQRVRISRQVTTRGDYGPLYDVKGLPCWPSEPLYEQIVQGAALEAAVRDHGANLEHYVSNWTDCGGERVLEAGTDFDHVILSVTHACLDQVVEPRIQAAWKDMLQRIQNVQTQALQLWLVPTIEQMGWAQSPVLLGAYIEPFSSIADFSHLIARENWPATAAIGNLTYTCGVLPVVAGESQAQADRRVWDHALAFCNTQIAPVFPKAVRPDNPDGLDWDKLYSPFAAAGPDRLRQQYLRANIDPAEQYVLSIPTTQTARRKAQDSGFGRLVITGTWIDTGLNISAVETATMAGLQASRAISGIPAEVPGEKDSIL